MEFKKADYDIATTSGEEPVSGYVCREFGIRNENGGWAVTHIPSGRKVTPLSRDTLSATKAACLEALDLWDWAEPDMQSVCDKNGVTPKEMADKCRIL